MSKISSGNIDQAIILADAAGRLAANFSCVDSPIAKDVRTRLLHIANDLLEPPKSEEDRTKDFEYFLEFSELAGEPDDVKEKLRRAFDAALFLKN